MSLKLMSVQVIHVLIMESAMTWIIISSVLVWQVGVQGIVTCQQCALNHNVLVTVLPKSKLYIRPLTTKNKSIYFIKKGFKWST